MMPPRYRIRRQAYLLGYLAGFVFSLAANLPGHLSFDSVVELLEGRTAAVCRMASACHVVALGVRDAILPGTALFATADTRADLRLSFGTARVEANWRTAACASRRDLRRADRSF